MKTLVAVLIGGLSGALLCLMGGVLLVTGARPIVDDQWPAIAAILFFGGGAISTYGLVVNAKTAQQVVARGFLLGAVEWLLMIGVGVIRSAVVGHGALSGLVIGGASLLMAVICLTGYLLVQHRRRNLG
jgi:hypothetical protein